ncbi:5-formyltetrahydrofolate cyclo-ligase [Haloarculaceae archaeon H-GB2-1]|nr:5-formyltetrahydrofolate cyclo-ligase [Haloarculaceae archaeon H-GB1-1]MEA5386969.1 5-formyltetrahydrofolate cyclo-ligase [Haloarculaceae archaeon H-GB11]MEA5408471.1 5-formyltetrahydrofolate cyclo-ligase [Haloarculaceae archaeon H-GB2-1]
MEKQTLRERVWDELDESGDARFPFPPHGRIPNFAGAAEAAEKLSSLAVWEDVETVKANPDSPQRPVRQRALEAGKTVYMAVPRLRDEKCFLELDPAEIDDYDRATTISGSSELGVQVGPDDVDEVDLVVSGSVAVGTDGERVGKGEGYSDLEYAVLSGLGLVDDATTVVSTVHEIQVRDEDIAVDAHDVPMDVVVTPERVVETETPFDRPDGIDWDALGDRVEEMPVLERLRTDP